MALTHTQEYTDNKKEDIIFDLAQRLIALKNRLVTRKGELLSNSAAIAADPGASAELKALGTQSENFINNAKITDFISFIENNLE